MNAMSGYAMDIVRTGAVLLVLAVAVGCGTAKTAVAPTESVAREPLVDVFPPAESGSGAEAHDESCALEPVYFAFDSSDLDPIARETAGRNARCLASAATRTLKVVGMTDPRGVEEYNLALGDRRARAVARYLSAIGVSAALRPSSVGEEMAAGSEEQGWAKDRRADLQAE